jgi:hypothetical protein
MKRLQLILVFVFTLFALTSVIFAQTETGQITGTVVDPSGAAVPGAAITVKSVATGAVRETKTAVGGEYNFTNLLPGEYTVSATAAGFSQIQQRATVTVGAKVGVDIRLEVGKSSTVVEVAGTAIQVNTETQSLSTTITGAQLNDLPTLNRDPYALVALSGNISDAGAGARGVGYSINGQRESGTNVLLDGAANNNEFTASVGQQVPQDSVAEFSVVTGDFTAEYGRASAGIVNLATKNGTNEFHGTAYEINRVSALSSNSFNNNAYDIPKSVFTRNQFGYSAGGPVKKNRLFFFSSTEWTRVASNATYQAIIPDPALIAASASNTQAFFTAYGKLASGSNVVQTYSLNQLAVAGNDPCPAGTTGPCAALNRNMPVYDLVNFSLPSDSGGGPPQQQYQTVNRIDYNMSDKTQIYGRVALQGDTFTPGYVSSSPWQGYNTGETDLNSNSLVSAIHTFSPRLISQTKLVFNRLNQDQPFGPSYAAVPTLYTTPNGSGTLLGQSILYPGYTPQAPGQGIPFGGPQNFIEIYEDLTYNFGKHSLRFGGSFEYLQDNRTFGAYETAGEYLGTDNTSALNGFLSGQLHEFQAAINPQGKYPGDTVNLPLGPPNFSRSNRYKEDALYVQDSWKVRPGFTVNLGLRWEFFGVPHNSNPALDSNFYFPSGEINTPQGYAAGAVSLAPNSTVGGLWAPDYKDFAPRVGAAWDVFGNGKTSLRGGYGIGYERNFGNVTFNAIQNPPNYETISVESPQYSLPISVSNFGPFSGTSGTVVLPPATLRVPLQNLKTAYAHTWSVSLEHQVTNNFLIGADYSGSKGERLYDISLYNRPGYGNVFLNMPCSYAAEDCSDPLNTQYGGMNTRGNNGFSDYNSLNLRTSLKNIGNSGLTLTANYTWSHAIDNLSTTFSDTDLLSNNWGQFQVGMLDPFDPQLNKGNADFDIRQRITVGAVWELPFLRTGKGLARKLLGGWTIAPLLTARTGSPYSLFDCTNAQYVCPLAAFTGAVSTSANSNPTVNNSAPNEFNFFNVPVSLVDHYTNPQYFFSDLPPFPSDMTTRNEFRAPGVWNMDMALSKTFLFTERFKLKLSGEAFNFFNHANMYVQAADADLSSATVIESCKACTGTASDRRNIQLSAKFIF